MKSFNFAGVSLLLAFLAVGITAGCSDDDDEPNDNPNLISQTEEDALLFMLEEEKMARDVYRYLDEEWNRPEFQNISKSEETHMAAIENLLELFGIPYTVLPQGEFDNSTLQELYDDLTDQGESSLAASFYVGATIEDLDIDDLESHINSIDNSRIISVFSSLQCGSRNHLRAFSSSLENLGVSYEPQYISTEEYLNIINSDIENCNQ